MDEGRRGNDKANNAESQAMLPTDEVPPLHAVDLSKSCDALTAVFQSTETFRYVKSALGELHKYIIAYTQRAKERASQNPANELAIANEVRGVEDSLNRSAARLKQQNQLGLVNYFINRERWLGLIDFAHLRIALLEYSYDSDAKEWRYRLKSAAETDHSIASRHLERALDDQREFDSFIEQQEMAIDSIQVCIAKHLRQRGPEQLPEETALLTRALWKLRSASGILEEVSHWTLTRLETKIGAKIGSGGVADVHRAVNQDQSNDVLLRFSHSIQGRRAPRETPTAVRCRCCSISDNIIRIFGADLSSNRPCTVMPLYSFNARDYVQRFPNCDRFPMILDIARGLFYLHNYHHDKGTGVVHGDVKAQNCLVSRAGGTVLCDFGLSKLKIDDATHSDSSDVSRHSDRGGSPHCMSPERLRGAKIDLPGDVYAFGMVVYEIYSEKLPFEDADIGQLYDLVCNKHERPLRAATSQLSDDVWDIVKKCWTSEANARPRAMEVYGLLSTVAVSKMNDWSSERIFVGRTSGETYSKFPQLPSAKKAGELKLRLTICRACRLPRQGFLKLRMPDAFVRIVPTGCSSSVETETIDSSVNPVWEEAFDIKVIAKTNITLEVRNRKDRRLIGTAVFSARESYQTVKVEDNGPPHQFPLFSKNGKPADQQGVQHLLHFKKASRRRIANKSVLLQSEDANRLRFKLPLCYSMKVAHDSENVEGVICRENRLLGEFELSGITPQPRGQAELVCTFEVDANGLLKVSAQDRTSGRKANITITNSVGRLSSSEIDEMIQSSVKFQEADKAFADKHAAKSELETLIATVEQTISSPEFASKTKRGQKGAVESQLAQALERLEIEESTSDELRKAHLQLRRALQKSLSSR